MRALRAALLALLVGSLGCGASSKQPSPPVVPAPVAKLSLEVRTLTLANGLRVVLQEDHHTPYVAVNVWYRVGSKDDPKDRGGLAHLFEHLMFAGSRHVKRDEHKKLLERAGALEQNAATDLDHTEFHETVPSSELALALWLESDRMAFVLDAIDQETLERERAVVKNERRQKHENRPFGMVPLHSRAALYPTGHPYHHATIGEPKELDAVSLDDVRAFWERYYAPNGATLALVGDFDRATAVALLEKYFGPIPRGKDPSPIEHAPLLRLPRSKTLVLEAGVPSGTVTFTWPTKPVFADTHCALVLLKELLGPPLERALVAEAKLADHVSLRYDAHLLGGTFSVTADLAKGSDPTRVRPIVARVLEEEARHPYSTGALSRASSGIFAHVTFGLEGAADRASTFNYHQHMTDNPIFSAPLLRRFDEVGPPLVRSVLQDHLVDGVPLVTVVATNPAAPVAGRFVEERP